MADYDYDKYDVETLNEVREDVKADESTDENGGDVVDSTDTVFEESEETESGRVTEKPESDTVEFTVVKSFTWHGQDFEIGDHELEQDDYDAMMYDINLRQDRVRLVL